MHTLQAYRSQKERMEKGAEECYANGYHSRWRGTPGMENEYCLLVVNLFL